MGVRDHSGERGIQHVYEGAKKQESEHTFKMFESLKIITN